MHPALSSSFSTVLYVCVVWCVLPIKDKFGKDVLKDSQATARLKRAPAVAKRKVSSVPEAVVEVDGLMEGLDISEGDAGEARGALHGCLQGLCERVPPLPQRRGSGRRM